MHTRLLQMPRFVRVGMAIDAAAQWHWLALHTLALWPTWWWMGQRMTDGSDDPLGILALAAMPMLLFVYRHQLRATPQPGLQVIALVGLVLTTALQHSLPDLLVALMGLLSLAAALLAHLPAQVATAPVWGLSVLSLPLMASLQFYAGFPLRVVTAEHSAWLLSWAYTVERTGSSLVVDGQLIIVDAPCSGVQMAWLGYFTACSVALLNRIGNQAFLMRLPIVGVLVLLGNIVRNTVLVAAQASNHPLDNAAHQAVGLAVLGLVCSAIAWAMSTSPPKGTKP